MRYLFAVLAYLTGTPASHDPAEVIAAQMRMNDAVRS